MSCIGGGGGVAGKFELSTNIFTRQAMKYFHAKVDFALQERSSFQSWE